MDFLAGQTLLFDKPKGWTSFDLVKKVRGTLRIKKVGHAGTLDPLATGLLILCTGKATKTIPHIQEQEKEYETCFKLGAVTASYDAEQPETDLRDASHIGAGEIEAAMPGFRGEISQLPPAYSAVKVDGQRAYKAARQGKTVALAPRPVIIYEFTLLGPGPAPDTWIARIRCSKGTYIRSLIHDLGQALEVGAYILDLRRTRIGGHHVRDAWQVEDFIAAHRPPQSEP